MSNVDKSGAQPPLTLRTPLPSSVSNLISSHFDMALNGMYLTDETASQPGKASKNQDSGSHSTSASSTSDTAVTSQSEDKSALKAERKEARQEAKKESRGTDTDKPQQAQSTDHPALNNPAQISQPPLQGTSAQVIELINLLFVMIQQMQSVSFGQSMPSSTGFGSPVSTPSFGFIDPASSFGSNDTASIPPSQNNEYSAVSSNPPSTSANSQQPPNLDTDKPKEASAVSANPPTHSGNSRENGPFGDQSRVDLKVFKSGAIKINGGSKISANEVQKQLEIFRNSDDFPMAQTRDLVRTNWGYTGSGSVATAFLNWLDKRS